MKKWMNSYIQGSLFFSSSSHYTVPLVYVPHHPLLMFPVALLSNLFLSLCAKFFLNDHPLDDRIKRGRGAVGSRMDETGPYLPSSSDIGGKQSITPLTDKREWQEKRVVLGPEKPSSISECSEDESDREMQMTKKVRSNKEDSGKHKSKEKSRSKDKKKKKRERKEKKRSSKHWK